MNYKEKILEIIKNNPHLNMVEICDTIGGNGTKICEQIYELEKEGKIERFYVPRSYYKIKENT
jgi:DNA-binding Lrp family transcriptional regulator